MLHASPLFAESLVQVPSGGETPETREAKKVNAKAKQQSPNVELYLQEIRKHVCRLYDVPYLLTNRKWIGTDTVVVELVTSTLEKSQEIAQSFKRDVQAIKCDVVASAHDVTISNISFQGQVDATPIFKLTAHTLWCEPNKISSFPLEDRYFSFSDEKDISRLFQKEMLDCERNQKRVLVSLKQATPSGRVKGKQVFESLEKVKSICKELASKPAKVGQVVACKLCEHIILATPKGAAKIPAHSKRMLYDAEDPVDSEVAVETSSSLSSTTAPPTSAVEPNFKILDDDEDPIAKREDLEQEIMLLRAKASTLSGAKNRKKRAKVNARLKKAEEELAILNSLNL
eukprot:g37362.t1